MFRTWLFLACAVCWISIVAGAEKTAPIKLHPENGHYFLWRDKPTILITSGEHYGALLNLDFDYEVYFRTLAKDGLNHTRIFSGTYREVPGSFKITDNTLAPKSGRYICPWARTKTKGYFDGGGKFNLKKWDDEYFTRLKKLMKAADSSGIVVEMTLFCPLYREELWKASPMYQANNVDGIGKCKRTEVLTLKHRDLLDVQLAFTRKIVTELNNFGNLYFEVCNEPYFGGVQMQWQHRIIDEIKRVEKQLPNNHLISLNIANGKKKVDKLYPGVSILNFHYCVPPDTVAMNFHHNVVIGENETGFRGKDDLLYRTECWDFLMAGGGLYNNLDYSFTPAHPDGTLTNYKSPGGGSPALRKQLGICKKFMYGMNFVKMKPDNSVIAEVSGKLSIMALIEPGKTYAVYLHVPLPKKPKKIADHARTDMKTTVILDLPKGKYAVSWGNTKTGNVDKTENLNHTGGRCRLASPPFDNDIALLIRQS